jgi:hypothetical protein
MKDENDITLTGILAAIIFVGFAMWVVVEWLIG